MKSVFERFIAQRKTAENIVSACIRHGVSAALPDAQERERYVRAWEQLPEVEQKVLAATCNTRKSRTARMIEAQNSTNYEKTMIYTFRNHALDTIAAALLSDVSKNEVC